MNEPTTQAIVVRESMPLTAAQYRDRVNLIQEVMAAVMKEGTHYGKLPGTDKPSLWKPGAEVLAVTFHLASEPAIEADLSTEDVVRYRIKCTLTHQVSGIFMGAGLGECSSNEEKYKWRAAVSVDEWNYFPESLRRLKFKRGQKEALQQVRTEPADLANTILKMAVKRATVAAILAVTGASDCFTQDIEDMPEEVRAVTEERKPNGNGNGHAKPAPAPASVPVERTAAAPAPPANAISEAQAKRFYAIWKGRTAAGWDQSSIEQLLKDHGIANDRAIPRQHYDALVKIVQTRTFAEYQDLKSNA